MIKVFSLLAAALLAAAAANAQEASRPNFLVIVSDDQRAETVGRYMPHVQRDIFNQGTAFTKGYITSGACCPSRSSIFTGQYISRHGVLVNNRPLITSQTLFHILGPAGYYTGVVGKLLNTWQQSPALPIDYLVTFKGGSSPYMNPRLLVHGKWRKIKGYMTYILRDYAVKFLDQAKQKQRPFILFFTPNAPHGPYTPAPEDRGKWKHAILPRSPSYGIGGKDDRPHWVLQQRSLARRLRGRTRGAKLRQDTVLQLEMLWSLDKAVGSILTALKQRGLLENTVVFYLSDNGVLWGEHNLQSKDCAYEEAIRVPFAVRYPQLFPQGLVSDKLVANIDIAPTILDIAGLPIPETVDGESIIKVLQGKSDRWFLLTEGFREFGLRQPYAAIHTGRYKYIINRSDVDELYDLKGDPFELANLNHDSDYLTLKADLRFSLLESLRRIRKPDSEAWKIFPVPEK